MKKGTDKKAQFLVMFSAVDRPLQLKYEYFFVNLLKYEYLFEYDCTRE